MSKPKPIPECRCGASKFICGRWVTIVPGAGGVTQYTKDAAACPWCTNKLEVNGTVTKMVPAEEATGE